MNRLLITDVIGKNPYYNDNAELVSITYTLNIEAYHMFRTVNGTYKLLSSDRRCEIPS